MKKKLFSLLALLMGLLLFVSCSMAGDAGKVYSFEYLSAWPLLVLAVFSAVATVPFDDSSSKKGMRALSALIARIAQLGGTVLCIAGFWRWDAHWGTTFWILMTFGALAGCASNASNKGLGAIVQLICAIIAVAACVFSYIQLW